MYVYTSDGLRLGRWPCDSGGNRGTAALRDYLYMYVCIYIYIYI